MAAALISVNPHLKNILDFIASHGEVDNPRLVCTLEHVSGLLHAEAAEGDPVDVDDLVADPESAVTVDEAADLHVGNHVADGAGFVAVELFRNQDAQI